MFLKNRLQEKYQRHVDVTFVTMHVTDIDVSFVTALQFLQLKQQSRFITARESPCENMDLGRLKHGN